MNCKLLLTPSKMGAFFSKFCCCGRSQANKELFHDKSYKNTLNRTRTNSNLIVQRSQLLCSEEFEFSVYSKELERDFEIKSKRLLYSNSENSNSFGSSWTSKSFERSFSNGETEHNKVTFIGLDEYPRKVFLVRHRESGQIFNLTRIKKSNLNTDNAERLCKEIGLIISRISHHELLINLYWTWQDNRYLYRVDEAALDNNIESVANIKELENLAVDLLIVLHYLHGCGLVHGNISPRAIFRQIETNTAVKSNQGQLRLGSFGYLRSLEGGKRLRGISGDFEGFRAPECNQANGEYFEEIDWFAYGKVLKFWLESIKTNGLVNDNDKNRNYDISIDKKRIELKDLIEKLTFVDNNKDNQNERLGYGPGGFKAIQSHPFFSSTTWNERINMSFSLNSYSNVKKTNMSSLNASIESLKRFGSGASHQDIYQDQEVDFNKFLEFSWDEKGEMGIMLESIIKRT